MKKSRTLIRDTAKTIQHKQDKTFNPTKYLHELCQV